MAGPSPSLTFGWTTCSPTCRSSPSVATWTAASRATRCHPRRSHSRTLLPHKTATSYQGGPPPTPFAPVWPEG
eukprot:1085367-Prymnesium_polylepis.1